MQVRKWLISGEINYNVCRICSLTLLPPEVLIPTPITLSVNDELHLHAFDARIAFNHMYATMRRVAIFLILYGVLAVTIDFMPP